LSPPSPCSPYFAHCDKEAERSAHDTTTVFVLPHQLRIGDRVRFSASRKRSRISCGALAFVERELEKARAKIPRGMSTS